MQLAPADLLPGDIISDGHHRAVVDSVELPAAGSGCVVARIRCRGAADWWAGVGSSLDVVRPIEATVSGEERPMR